MMSVDETFAKIPGTWRAAAALGAAVLVGATAMAMLQNFVGIPAQIEKLQEAQATQFRKLEADISSNQTRITGLEAAASAIDGRRLADAIEQLAFQLCVDRRDRVGPLTPADTEACRLESRGLIRR